MNLLSTKNNNENIDQIGFWIKLKVVKKSVLSKDSRKGLDAFDERFNMHYFCMCQVRHKKIFFSVDSTKNDVDISYFGSNEKKCEIRVKDDDVHKWKKQQFENRFVNCFKSCWYIESEEKFFSD